MSSRSWLTKNLGPLAAAKSWTVSADSDELQEALVADGSKWLGELLCASSKTSLCCTRSKRKISIAKRNVHVCFYLPSLVLPCHNDP